MRILITGATGFVGRHLIQHLQSTQPDAKLFGTVYRQAESSLIPDVQYETVDLVDDAATLQLIETTQPDIVYHLAGQSSPALSFHQPWRTLETNIRAQINLFEACRKLNARPKILITSSAEIYGVVQPDEVPITEDHPLRPVSPYSLSKVTQDLMGYQYFVCYQLPVIRIRAFNHIGRGQSENFVAPAFAMQIAQIEATNKDAIIEVGNLEAKRDFTDVRDVVSAYKLLADHGKAGETYNVASNKAHSIQELLDILIGLSRRTITTQVDPERLRPSDIPIIQGDSTKLIKDTGWSPRYSFEETLADVLDDCRERIKG